MSGICYPPNTDSQCEAAGVRIHLQYWFGDPTNWLITYSPTVGDRNNLLRESEEQFGKSDQSAYSIVPSRMSMSIYTSDTIDSGASKSEENLVYKPLAFENELFTARVYKRNYRTPALQRLFKGIEQKTSDNTRSPTVAQEIGEHPDGSEADDVTIREPGPTRWSQNEARIITSRREEGQPAGDEDTGGEMNRSPNAEPPISFADACAQGHVEIVETFLQSGQDVHIAVLKRKYRNFELLDLSAIHIAAIAGHSQVVELLLSCGADKEMLSCVSRKRPLHLAVQAGHVAMVRYLLDKGTNIAAPDGEGAQAIHVAAGCGSMVILSLLVDRGAAIDSAMTNGDQPLHIASQNPDRANAIRFLCSQGTDIEAKTHRGYTPLYYASVHNHVDNMKALLELGAAHNPQGLSMLGIAVQRGYLQATRLLLERGVDPNCPVSGEGTALHKLIKGYTVERYPLHKYADVVIMLLENGAEVDLQDTYGDTPLHCLCSRREKPTSEQEKLQLQLATILLRNTRDVDTINYAGETAFGLSIKRRCGVSLIQSVFASGGRLLLTKPGTKIRFQLDKSSDAYGSFLTCRLRQGDDMFTMRVGTYDKGDHDSPHLLNRGSIRSLRRLLQDPESLYLMAPGQTTTKLTSMPHNEPTSVPSMSTTEPSL